MSTNNTPAPHQLDPLVCVGSSERLGLLPEREGQPRTLEMRMPWEYERGHWYSPAAVREMMNAAVAAERERWRLRVLGLQAQYADPACRAALKHAAVYGTKPEA